MNTNQEPLPYVAPSPEEVRQVIEQAAEIIGSDYRNIGVVQAAIEWLAQRAADAEAEAYAERQRLNWLLPRQYDHKTRESVDAELSAPNEQVSRP